VEQYKGMCVRYYGRIILQNYTINHTDENGPYILQSEVEKAIKEMRNKKATGDDDVPGDVLKLLEEGGVKIMTKLINTISETEEWPKDFTEVTMIAL
jgi:hypothetical protein